MRGKVQQKYDNIQKERITPAYAGKSGELCNGELCIRDHPRVCGEKPVLDSRTVCRRGSSPRMRGKAVRWIVRRLTPGITPAYAGKRPGFSGPFLPTGDHPRVCGEKVNAFDLVRLHKGSPPRVRGKGGQSVRNRRQAGITPACAGKRYIIGIDNGLI